MTIQNVDHPINRRIRLRIRDIRLRKRLSVRKAAILCGIPESSYSCMENGFYRISLPNLKKILSGLNVSINEVWPEEGDSGQELSLINQFRFEEIRNLTGAKKAALLTDGSRPEFIYLVNLTEGERQELVEALEVGLSRGWKVFRKRGEQATLALCLQGGDVPEHLKRLIQIYLELWLTEFLTKVA